MTRSAIRHTLSALAAVALVSAFSGNPASAQEDLKSIMAGVKAHNSQEDLKSIMGGVKAHVIREQRSLAAQQSPASRKMQGTFADPASKMGLGSIFAHVNQRVSAKFPTHRNREFFGANRESYSHIRQRGRKHRSQ